jgi:hypothetical protein
MRVIVASKKRRRKRKKRKKEKGTTTKKSRSPIASMTDGRTTDEDTHTLSFSCS